MGRDFRIGLICGLVLAVVALIWVATRPSLTPRARMLRPAFGVPPSGGLERSRPQPGFESDRLKAELQTPREALPPGLIAAEPEAVRMPTTAPDAVDPGSPLATQPHVPDLTIYEQKEKIKTTKFHIVRRGETLSSIAQQYYGAASRWQKILEANRDNIKDANKITPGTKLIIPD